MKIALVILAIGLIVLGVLFVNYKQTATQQLTEANQKIDATTEQLKTVSNDVLVARVETVNVKTQMEAKVEQLQQQVTTINSEKEKIQAQAQELTTKLDATKHDLEQEQAKVDGLEKQNQKLTAEIQSVNQQLAGVNQKLANLEKTHATTVGHLTAMREDYVALTKEKVSLESKLHDLTALKEQLQIVKEEIYQRKVDERKRLDRAEAAMGNAGFVMKNGNWSAPRYSGKYPLTEDIHREP